MQGMGANLSVNQTAFLAAWLASAMWLEGEHLPARVYTVADGLASVQVSCIVQDSHGFIWFCSSEGLSRFDGYRFQNFGTEQGLHGRVSALLETSSGEYLIASSDGLYHFNPGRASPFTLNRLGGHGAGILATDGAGGIWCGTSGGLYHLERAPNAGHSSDASQWRSRLVDVGMPTNGENSRVNMLLRDRDGVLWIAAYSGLYRRFLDGRNERYTALDGLYSDYVTSLLQDRQGRLWVGTFSGLCRISTKQNPADPSIERVSVTKIGLKGIPINALLESSDGRFWIGTPRGLYELRYRDGQLQFENHANAHGPTANYITSLMEDRLGNVWIACAGGGAIKLAKGGFVTFTRDDGLANEHIRSIFETLQGMLCVVTQAPSHDDIGKWVNWFDGQRFHAVRPNSPPEVKYGGWGEYQVTFQDHAGEWWVPTGDGLFRFSGISGIVGLGLARPRALFFKPGRDGEAHEEAFRIFEDSRGDIWIGAQSAAGDQLMRWERATGKLHRCGKVGLTSAFAEDRAGNVWIGFIERGLARYRDGRLHFFGKAEGVPEGWIYALYPDSQGRLWIASSGGGVARIDSPGADVPSFVNLTTTQGLTANYTRCITEDRWGRIYVGGSRGVDCFYPRAPFRLRHYTTADGLVGGEMRTAFRDRKGALWFGTSLGLSRLEPQADQWEPAPPIVISALRVRGEPRAISAVGESAISGLVLGANQNQVQVDFVSPDFRPSAPLRYQYRLEDVDADWSAPIEARSVNFATLAPGSYRLLVRALTMEGVASDQPAIVAFTILRPYWARWWFRMLALALLAGAIYAVYRMRVGRLMEVERLRTRIATDLHDDIGASLSRIAIMSEVLHQRGTRKTPAKPPSSPRLLATRARWSPP
jgi:ligand-binding sensor domain-containing protein